MSDQPLSAFGNRATTAIFAVIVSFAVVVLIGLAFFSYKYSFRAMFGVYDPVFKQNTRYSYMFENDMPARIIQPYVIYNGINYYMFGNEPTRRHRHRVKKIEVLTEDQLTEMFPLKTYAKWLHGGKEEVQNLTNGKLGYKEQFENIGDENVITNVNTNDEIELEVVNTVNKDKTIEETDTTSKSVIEVGTVPEETDITDMLPSKVEHIVTSTSDPFNNTQVNATHEHENGEKHFTSGTCTICLDAFEDDDSVRGLICGHVFHQICIDPWLTVRAAYCPICKKDLYIEIPAAEGEEQIAEHEANDENTRMNFNMNEIIHLPVGEPGDTELDDLFNIHVNNNFSFFIILVITRLKAQILLAALLYLRNNDYSLDAPNDDGNEDSPNNNTIELNVEPHEQLNALFYSDLITSKFDQKNATDSFDTPPIPDINNLNPYIKRIVEHHPRPFNPADLVDLDYTAWKETKRLMRGPKRLYFMSIGVSKLQIYYHNVIRIYNNRRKERMNHVDQA